MKVIFNSSLPRSGSTLVQNILAQNSRFHCSPTSGLLNLLLASRRAFSNAQEFKACDPIIMTQAWLGFCRSGIDGFYSAITNAQVVSEKGRGWIACLDWLNSFYPNPRIFSCVRDIRSIMVSMEKLRIKNSHLHDEAFDNPGQINFSTIDRRVLHWMNSIPVGSALNNLKDALDRGFAKDLHFVIYENLMSNPQEEMDNLYDYLEEPRYKHDFSNIEQRTIENDAWHGIYGEHTIRPVIEPNNPDWNFVLGSGLSQQLVSRNWWFYSVFYPQSCNQFNVA